MKTKTGKMPQPKYFGDLLPYAYFDEHQEVLWLKDGSATKTFEVVAKTCLSATDEELELLRLAISSQLNQLPENTIVQVRLVREKTTEVADLAMSNWTASHNAMISEIALGTHNASARAEYENPRQALFEARRELLRGLQQTGRLFQTRVYITVRIAADSGKAATKIGPLSHIIARRDKRTEKTRPTVETQLMLATTAFKTGLETAGFETQDVTGPQLQKIIFETLNPERSYSGSFQSGSQSYDYSDAVALTDLVETRRGLKLGNFDVRIGTLKTLPEATIPALFGAAATLCQPFTLCVTLITLPQTPEKERLTRKQRLMQGMVTGNAVRNLVAEAQLQDIEDTLSMMISSGEKLFAASFHLITSEQAESGSESQFPALISELEKLGSGCRWFEETVGAYPVFFSVMPFAPAFITRPKRMLSSVLSDLLPLFGIGPGHKMASVLFETPYQSAIGFSLFENSPSGNGILIGSTGSGKSTLACGLILGWSAGTSEAAPAAFVVDVGNSFKRAVQYLGGTTLDLSPEKGLIINPFDLDHGESVPNPEKVKFLTALFDEILGEGGNLTKLERALLETEILIFYENSGAKTLTAFRDHLTKSDSTELKRLAKLLTLWCKPHPYGLLLDGQTNVALDNAPHIHFELKGCQRYPDLLRVAMLVVMDLIWRRIKARAPRQSIIAIDEAHTIIRPASDGRANTGARWVEDLFRQMRKFSSAAIAISQTAKDLKSAEIGDGILANAPNRFILRQRGDEKTLREDLKLNERELADVFALSQVRGSFSEFYLNSESIKGVFVYRPTSLELWLSTTHPPDNELLDKTWSEHPNFGLQELMAYMANHYPNGAEGGFVP